MGTQYVDDHRFLLCKGSTVTDITRAVSQPEARDELDALSVELTFTAVRNNNRDKYMHWYGIEPGDKLRVVNHGREVFSGVILTVGLDGTVTANDMGWYLTKSEIILQLADAAAPDAVRRMCAKAGIAAGTIDLPPTRISQVWVGPYIADALVAQIENFQGWVGELVADANPLLSALLVDGIIGGVGAVVGFLPLVMVMYFLIALLEDCGYMSRVAVVLDPIFKKVGLSGKSVIPFVIGIGCGIPGVMACRTIRNERERRATAMLTTFMPCGAKIPVIALFAGAFFDDAGWVSFLMYFTGIVLIFLGALLVNKIAGYKNRKSFFIIELPEYKVPSLWFAFKAMCARGWA